MRRCYYCETPIVPISCPACQGSGQMHEVIYLGERVALPTPAPCSTCHGSGWIQQCPHYDRIDHQRYHSLSGQWAWRSWIAGKTG